MVIFLERIGARLRWGLVPVPLAPDRATERQRDDDCLMNGAQASP
jgi:hypothetical protein